MRKMAPALIGFLCLVLATPTPANALDDLKAALGKLNGQETIKASVDRQIWSSSGDAKDPEVTQGKVNAAVEEGPEGLRILWSRATLQQATQEAKAQGLDPEKTSPTRRAMEGLRALDLVDYFSSSEELLRNLEDSQFQEEKAETWEGRPSKCLTLKVTPRLPAREKKYIKELVAVAKIWIGADGVPLAAERTVIGTLHACLPTESARS